MGNLLKIMNQFFQTNAETYESIRKNMDFISGYPSEKAETWFAPASDAAKDADGNILIAAMPIIAEQFITAGAQQINEDEYRSNLPTLESILPSVPSVVNPLPTAP